MESFLGYLEVVGAIIAAFGLAAALQWIGLYGLTSLMSETRNETDRGGPGKTVSGLF
jgi:hypothetical protein